MELRIIREADIQKGMRVIVRADLDVGVKNGKIADDFRLRAGMPTLRYLIRRGARIRIVGYLGRPQGKRDEKLTLEPIARRLRVLLGQKVILLSNPFGRETMQRYQQSPEILLFENIRFWPEEISNSPSFARRIARWGDCYVNDAFANCHRREASLVAVPKLLPSYAGLHLVDEIAALERVMKNPRRPFVAIIGGAKIETKLPLIKRFLRDADRVLVGGALANVLFAAAGKSIGKSRTDAMAAEAITFLKSKKMVLPHDVVAAEELAALAVRRICSPDDVGGDEYIADIGPGTRAFFAGIIREAGTVIWNGPMGFVEVSAYGAGTRAVAEAARDKKIFSVVGGGDTIAALKRLRMLQGFSHISTGGGAMLAFLAGEKLPGLGALKK